VIDRVRSAVLICVFLAGSVVPVFAGTTGGLRGRVVDAETNTAVAGVTVTVMSPSQSSNVQTDAAGGFSFLSLSPDTYVISVQRPGYDALSAAGLSVFADQVQTVGTFWFVKTIKTIGGTTARATTSLVRPGTTSDVYSINAAAQAASAAVGGPGGLNQAYSAIATTPGANVPQGQQGWNQLVYIRGGDYSDVSNELDGIPVQRASDFAPITTLSSLGSQEVQTYTGGTPPSAEASGLSGYINQVIKTGTYPGYEAVSLGVGGPTSYHKLSVEASGATTDRNFSYYIGLGGENQDYRYSDQFNGAAVPLFFYPLQVPTGLNGKVYDGSGPALFSPGQSYAIAHTSERNSLGNFHVKIPHKSGGLKDDIQLLFVTSDIKSDFFSSPRDLGGTALLTQAYGGPALYTDQYLYAGPLFAAPDPARVRVGLSPSSPQHPAFAGPINLVGRDADDHNATIYKLQYQKNFSSRSYLRLFGYGEYTDWFINGPTSAFTTFGGELQNYEVHGNTFGATAVYANQLSDKHLLTLTGSYQTQKLETYNGNTYRGAIRTNLVDAKGNCYSPSNGNYASCYTLIYNPDGTLNPSGGLNSFGNAGAKAPGFPSQSLTPVGLDGAPLVPPASSPAATNGARNLVTNDGRSAQIDEITPFFAAASLADQWHPSDRLTLNAGLRLENYTYRLDNTVGAGTLRGRSGSTRTTASMRSAQARPRSRSARHRVSAVGRSRASIRRQAHRCAPRGPMPILPTSARGRSVSRRINRGSRSPIR